MADTNSKNVGKVVEIRGVVIDAVFHERLPAIYNALALKVPAADGRPEIDLIAEVQQHLGKLHRRPTGIQHGNPQRLGQLRRQPARRAAAEDKRLGPVLVHNLLAHVHSHLDGAALVA